MKTLIKIKGTDFTKTGENSYYLNNDTSGQPQKTVKGLNKLSFQEAENLVEMLDSPDHSITSAWNEIFKNRMA